MKNLRKQIDQWLVATLLLWATFFSPNIQFLILIAALFSSAALCALVIVFINRKWDKSVNVQSRE